MGNLFRRPKPPPAPDYSEIRKQQAEQKRLFEKQTAEIKREKEEIRKKNEARRRNFRTRARGRRLLVFGETGYRGVRDELGK